MKRAIKGVQYTCDNESCSKSVTLSKEQEEINGPPLGLSGTISWITDGGDDGGDWWACSITCVAGAIEGTLGMTPGLLKR
jgi:hypothetical protein